MGRSALVLGANGLVGGKLLEQLLKDDKYEKVTYLGRKEVNKHPKLTQILLNLDKLDHFHSEFQVNDVYCCLGTTIKKAGSQGAFTKVDYEYPLKAAQLAKAGNADQYLIISAMGANPTSRIFYNRVKGKVEEELKKLNMNGLHIFRPSLLLGKREEFRFGEKMAEWLFKPISNVRLAFLRKYGPIEAETVAIAMKRIALKADKGIHIYESEQIKNITKR
ncbi:MULTISPECIES: oxidoreductase [unclassified Bacillus (in: firmicutes)]|uniref:oxidoreductase n=1 Tax=unclassified Bacillus (in: firmicutes) TaxID=185979 RepID=UPI0008F26282|nr:MULTISPECIES: oxidoreductase [unclassified Bacillus (in: firmicutes)]SFA77019.1 Uncharacterized conserved protein YbjT, contains NAD(P)-binding and DUF2867 domains [Bacillus sp. UNCCL13]SFQ66899.1 Uncharacterized conserved protein YbjT, contains NAD(P)-binding and DUF2867 domains [Bacillus sp. cl95]